VPQKMLMVDLVEAVDLAVTLVAAEDTLAEEASVPVPILPSSRQVEEDHSILQNPATLGFNDAHGKVVITLSSL